MPRKGTLSGVSKTDIPHDWVARYPPDGGSTSMFWSDGSFVNVIRRDRVNISVRDFALASEDLARRLARVDFEVAAFGSVRWWNNPEGLAYDAPDSRVGTAPLGFAMAFRGKGHDRAMSRRWLDRGPWRALREAHDTTLVQFHDLAADDELSAEQARPAHALMADPDQQVLPARHACQARGELKGIYVQPDRQLVVSVAGRRVPRSEMHAAVAARTYQLLGPESPHDKPDWVMQLGRDDRLS